MTETTVEAVCWDISLGIVGTGFGRWLLGRTTSSKELKPEAVDHVGLKVYDYLYEYGDQGILRTKIQDGKMPKSKYPAYALRSVEPIGTTTTQQEMFEGWIADVKEGKFRGKNYNVVTNSCIAWGIDACKFLGVPHPPNWDKILNWAKENNTVAQLVGRSGMGSRVASTALVKPQSD